MRILITRPIEDGEETARQLALRGHEALVAPLLMLRFLGGPDVTLEGVQAILATSANGVRALARRTKNRDLPLFAVGPQTAAEAQKLGFQSVKSAGGDAETLALATTGWARPEEGALLHVAGEGNDARLIGNLPGFTVRQEILYAVDAVEKMPEAAAAVLRAGELDAALFYSPRSAAIFRECAVREGLPVNALLAICISAATATALAPLGFREVRVADRPNQASLLKFLG
jgi:uroporphyrinogen-III synthase